MRHPVSDAHHVSPYLLPALLLLAGCAGGPDGTAGSPAIPLDRAMAIVWQLPEVREWDGFVRTTTADAVHGALLPDADVPVPMNDALYWQMAFIENGPETAHRWVTFLVHTQTGAIMVEDILEDRVFTLEYWRAQQVGVRASAYEAVLDEAFQRACRFSLELNLPNSMARPEGFDINAHLARVQYALFLAGRVFRSRTGVQFLERQLAGAEDEQQVFCAIRLLGDSGMPEAIPVLAGLTKHPNHVFGRHAREALERLPGDNRRTQGP